MPEYDYRGYRIQTRRTSDWHANIRPLDHPLLISETPEATRAEGEAVLLERAKEAVDRHIALVEAAKKKPKL